jgi:hypothetical protein
VWYDGTTYTAEELQITYDLPGAPSTVNSLVDLATFKEAVGDTGSTNDSLYTRLLQAASQAVLNFTDRDFNTDVVTETRDVDAPDRGNIIDIDDAVSVIDVTGLGGVDWRVGSEGPAASAGVYTYIEVAAFRADSPLMGFTRNEDLFGFGFSNNVQVTADWGWPDVPADVVQAVIWATEDFAGDISNPSGALAAKSVAEVAENYLQQSQQRSPGDTDPLSPRVTGLLVPYRRVTLS